MPDNSIATGMQLLEYTGEINIERTYPTPVMYHTSNGSITVTASTHVASGYVYYIPNINTVITNDINAGTLIEYHGKAPEDDIFKSYYFEDLEMEDSPESGLP